MGRILETFAVPESVDDDDKNVFDDRFRTALVYEVDEGTLCRRLPGTGTTVAAPCRSASVSDRKLPLVGVVVDHEAIDPVHPVNLVPAIREGVRPVPRRQVIDLINHGPAIPRRLHVREGRSAEDPLWAPEHLRRRGPIDFVENTLDEPRA